MRVLFLRETCLPFGRIRSECAEIFVVNAAVVGACGAIAVGARIPCADPKPPQIRKKIAQTREMGSAVGATEVVFKFLEKGASHSGAAGASEKRPRTVKPCADSGCGSRTRTCDLWVMSPTSYRLLYPASNCVIFRLPF